VNTSHANHYQLNPDNFWYVAPRSALKSVEREFMVWGVKIQPTFMTYEKFTSAMKDWTSGKLPPRVVVFDEASKLKNPTAQRSQAAKALADGMRDDFKDDCWIMLLTGSPAPKSPADWYWLAEVARPGFLKEGDYHKFKNRLALIVQKENSVTGGVYPQLVTWLNDPAKCATCGELKDTATHNIEEAAALGVEYHEYKQSVNEVAFLYKRLQGLVLVKFKKDCLDLPDKHYRIIQVKPTQSTLRAAKLIVAGAKTVISGLIRVRELSDGFQYIETPRGKEDCPRCKNNTVPTYEYDEIPNTCPNCTDRGIPVEECLAAGLHQPERKEHEVTCPNCGGTGQVQAFDRDIKEVPCPKEQVLKDLLDEYEDIGRVVIYGGFTGSIDRCVRVAQQCGWAVIRVDQSAWRAYNYDGNPISDVDHLSMFQDMQETYPKVAFIANPGSAGMGLTLTASPVIIYYSNDFNAENRIQSEDRIHRPGMDANLGATIIDIIHLPTDEKILANLKMKRELQSMSLGEFEGSVEDYRNGKAGLTWLRKRLTVILTTWNLWMIRNLMTMKQRMRKKIRKMKILSLILMNLMKIPKMK
jgi:SNF2 family DNA or RNA helicase